MLLTLACLRTAALSNPEGEDEAVAKMRAFYFALDYEEAVFQGRELMARHPASSQLQAWALLNLAAYRQFEEAVSQAEAMLDGDRQDPWAWFALSGVLLQGRKRKEESTESAAEDARQRRRDLAQGQGAGAARQDGGFGLRRGPSR
ncbi:MAG: hypothetical protein V3T83_04955 [Acidobacteriota bacterium]